MHLLLEPPEHVIARHELSSAMPKLRTLGFTCLCTLTAIGAGAFFGGYISKDTPHYFNTSLPIWHGREDDFEGVEGVDYVTCDKVRSCTDNLSAVTVFMFGLPVLCCSYALGRHFFFREKSYWVRNHLKVSSEVVAARQLLPARQRLIGAGTMSVQRHLVKKWGLSRVSGCGAGVAAGALGTLSLIFGAVYDLYGKTDHYARTNGLFGCLYGFAASLISISLLPLSAVVFLALRTGVRCSFLFFACMPCSSSAAVSSLDLKRSACSL